MPRDEHLAIDHTNPLKIHIINGVHIVTPKLKSVISSQVTHVIKGPSDIVKILPPMCDTPHAIEPSSVKFIFQLGEVDSGIDKEITENDIGLNCIRPTPSTHLSIIKCVPS